MDDFEDAKGRRTRGRYRHLPPEGPTVVEAMLDKAQETALWKACQGDQHLVSIEQTWDGVYTVVCDTCGKSELVGKEEHRG